jgi:hypothetical protein
MERFQDTLHRFTGWTGCRIKGGPVTERIKKVSLERPFQWMGPMGADTAYKWPGAAPMILKDSFLLLFWSKDISW